MKSIEVLEKIKEVGDTKKLRLEEIYKLIGFDGSLECFRTICWRFKIPFAKGYHRKVDAVLKLKKKGYKFSKATLPQIKKLVQYEGGLDGLAGLLQRHGVTWRKRNGEYTCNPEYVRSLIKELGDTSTLTPQQIFAKIGMEVRNPSQCLKRLAVPYRKKKGRPPLSKEA